MYVIIACDWHNYTVINRRMCHYCVKKQVGVNYIDFSDSLTNQ